MWLLVVYKRWWHLTTDLYTMGYWHFYWKPGTVGSDALQGTILDIISQLRNIVSQFQWCIIWCWQYNMMVVICMSPYSGNRETWQSRVHGLFLLSNMFPESGCCWCVLYVLLAWKSDQEVKESQHFGKQSLNRSLLCLMWYAKAFFFTFFP